MEECVHTTPLCLKAIGLELPHQHGARTWRSLHVHYGDTCYLKAKPCRAALPSHMPQLQPEDKELLAFGKRKPGDHYSPRLTFGHWHRWPYHFYSLKLPNKGLVLPSSTLSQLTCILWLRLYDPQPYPPIFHLLCSDAVQHPLTKQLQWKTHKLWTLACLWPTYTQVVEQTDCGCGVRVTVRF